MMNTRTWIYGLMLALITGLVGLPAEAKKNQPPPVELTAQGQALEAKYAKQMQGLQADLLAALPKVSDHAKASYTDALAAEIKAKADLEAAQKQLGQVGSAHGLIGHAKNHWIPKADRGIKAANDALAKAKTQAEREAAQKELATWQANREEGLKALKERQDAYDRIKQNEPKLKDQVNQAQQEAADAKARALRALSAMKLDSFLETNRHDAKLAKFVVLKEATPRGLAVFAQQGAKQAKLIEQLLADDALLVQMVLADGAKDGNYGRAIEIYSAIQASSPKAKQGVLQQLALAISLEHATPIKQRNAVAATDAPEFVDPVARYAHYEAAFLNNELDPYFGQQSAWDLRFVVDGEEPNSVLAWGREMLRNYRPDLITTKDDRWRYVSLVRTCVRYGSQENKNDKDELQFYQNILMNGGICGRRAFFGRFILRSFGSPTIARPQKGHAALARWTPEGWVVCLGAGWGSGWTKTRYKDDLDFLATTQARAAGGEAFMPVKRAQWVGDVVGEKAVYGLNDRDKPGFWYSVSLNTQRDLAAKAKTLAAVGEELGEANESKVKYPFESAEISDADRKVSVDRNGVITIPAAATSSPTKSTGKVLFTDSVLGGKQLHYSRTGKDQDIVYTFDAPAAGTYNFSMRVSSPAWKQGLDIVVNANKPVGMELPHTVGLWEMTQPIKVELVKGKNTLTLTRTGVTQEVAVKGFSIKDYTLTPLTGNRQ